MSVRRCFMIFALIAALSLCVLYYVTPSAVSTLAVYALTVNSSHRTILFWNSFFGDQDFGLRDGYFARDCPRYNNCFATHSRFLRSVDTFDAVVFHGINEEFDPSDLPAKRQPGQKYVFVALESPANRHIRPEFDNYFNATMTYHLDSDVVWTYADIVDRENESVHAVPTRVGYFEWKRPSEGGQDEEEEEEKRLESLIAGKRKLAVWYRSNCETRSRRELYVAELEKHVAVAKYGACSEELGCPKDQDCFKTDVEPNYFFYLSFENSLCDDYVTEKFFNALKHNVVPVVYGGANYSQFAPPHSYINALDFDSPKELAKYLIELSKDSKGYKKYFDWKRRYKVVSPRQRVICDLCALLNKSDFKKSHTAISKWYSSASRCPLQKQLDKQVSHGGPDYVTRNSLLGN